MGQAQINVRTRACSRTSIARTRQAALTHNVRGKELKYLHPTATCLTRPADSRMLDYIPAKEANRHGSFQICGDYYDIS